MVASPKSAIREVRDQLFLDRAVGKYLSRVSSNLGLERPLFGFSNDATWRAVVRRLAVDYRQIANLFEDLLRDIFGPKNTVASVLSVDTEVADEELSVGTITKFPQRGTLVIDETLASEESIEFSFLDPLTSVASLSAALTLGHTAVVDDAVGYLVADVSASATSLVLVSSDEFPTSGYPITLLVGAGADEEEVVQVTAHTPATNTLTVSALANDHAGPQSTPITSRVSFISGTNYPDDSVVIRVEDSSKFPSEGLIRVQEDGGTPTQIVEYYDNDITTNTLRLKQPLASQLYTFPWTGAGGSSVTLMRNGAEVRLAQVQVKGIGWDVFETEPKRLQIYIPDQLALNRLQDASFLHQALVSPTPSSTLDAATLAGDTSFAVPTGEADDFPSSGMLIINSGGGSEEVVSYTLRAAGASTKMYAVDATGIPIGTTELFVEDAKVLAAFATTNTSKTLTLARNDVPNVETVTYTAIDVVANKVTLAAPGTANVHSSGDEIIAFDGDTFFLAQPLQNAHSLGETVDLRQEVYAGTSLEDGRIEDGVTYTTDHLFQGPYVYASAEDRAADSEVSSTLDEDIAGPIELMVDQQISRYSLEVRNADLLKTTGVFDIQVGRGHASNEILAVKTVGLASTFNALGVTVNATSTTGDTQLTLTATGGLPQPSSYPYGYRIAVGGQGGAGTYEIVVVRRILSGTVIELDHELQNTHNASEVVTMLNDVIELSDPVSKAQQGVYSLANRFSEPGTAPVRNYEDRVLVEELRSYVDVVSASGFPALGGWAIINFGRSALPVESRLTGAVAAGATSLVLESSDDFPTTYPYFVIVGADDPAKAEFIAVTVNNPATETLTVPSGLKKAHSSGVWVRYFSGEQVAVEFQGTETGGATERLIFDPPIKFAQAHREGEPVHLSEVTSQPDTLGLDFPLYLPSDWADRLEFLFDRGRAAGVEVVVISDR